MQEEQPTARVARLARSCIDRPSGFISWSRSLSADADATQWRLICTFVAQVLVLLLSLLLHEHVIEYGLLCPFPSRLVVLDLAGISCTSGLPRRAGEDKDAAAHGHIGAVQFGLIRHADSLREGFLASFLQASYQSSQSLLQFSSPVRQTSVSASVPRVAFSG